MACGSKVSERNVLGRTQICVACNGKIYSFYTRQKRFYGWAFDPNISEWREIEDRPVNVCDGSTRADFPNLRMNRSYLRRIQCGVAVLKKEIYLGWTYGSEMMVFDTVTEMWRTVPDTMLDELERLSVTFNCFELTGIKDKLYTVTRSTLEVYTGHTEPRSWTTLQRTFNEDFNNRFGAPDVAAVVASGNELVALLETDTFATFRGGFTKKLCKSKGFGVEGSTLIWEAVPDFVLQKCFYGYNDLVLDHVEV